ncbi:unnamed protein product [Coccothraustes coccothraustes]
MKGGSPGVGRGAIAELGELRQAEGVVEPGDEWGPGPPTLKVLSGSGGSAECLEWKDAGEVGCWDTWEPRSNQGRMSPAHPQNPFDVSKQCLGGGGGNAQEPGVPQQL